MRAPSQQQEFREPLPDRDHVGPGRYNFGMGPAFGDELIWIEAVGLYEEGMHADEVCRRYGINRRRLAQWCDWVDFRSTWPIPGRQPPVPSPAPDYAPESTADDPAPSG